MLRMLKPAVLIFVFLTIVCGVIYPLAVTGVAQVVFPHQANGSLISGKDGAIAGSSLIGQAFTDPKYFWSRPSATSPAYNASASSGSNLGPTNEALLNAVTERVGAWQTADPENKKLVPVDLVTASGSGLDPHISLAAAQYQAERVAKVRGWTAEKVAALINKHASTPMVPGLGTPTVHVLELNLDMDSQS